MKIKSEKRDDQMRRQTDKGRVNKVSTRVEKLERRRRGTRRKRESNEKTIRGGGGYITQIQGKINPTSK
jgi:hypothetical protein